MKKNYENYNHKASEKKWQEAWGESGAFKFDEKSEKEKYYVLEMFPYPSGKIHMGHLRNYAIGDVIARFKRAKGLNVLHPMGFDSFGLPAENAALEHGVNPRDWTLSNIETMREELQSVGLSVDWSRELATCLPNYFKHEQKIFIDFVKNDLAYQKESFVNWDPVDQTVLANEQVIDGKGWRSGAVVEKKKLKQWFLRVSEFADELLDELKGLDGWDERVVSMQEKWIGRSEGAVVRFEITEGAPYSKSEILNLPKSDRLDNSFTTQLSQGDGNEVGVIEVYTTRPDTLFGASFVAISPNHPLALGLAEENTEIAGFIEECNKVAADEASLEKQEKKGIKTGLKVKHPFDEGWELDVFVANFVLMDYGTGAVFGCPAHDERDFEFAKKYDLPIKKVVADLEEFLSEDKVVDFSDSGIQEIVKDLRKKSKDEIEFVQNAFALTRDGIRHAMDDQSCNDKKPLFKASETLREGVGFSFGKCALFAAILRGNGIACGFSDQLLVLDEDKPERKIIHTVSAVYLKSLKRWVRLDHRGGKEENVGKKVDLSADFMAYEAEDHLGEVENLGIYAKYPAEVFELHQKSTKNSQILDNLFDKSSAMMVDKCFTGDGVIFNSSFLDGSKVDEAKTKAIDELVRLKKGERKINYRLRDWGVSRQRYWGCPIPMLYLEDGSVVAVPEDQLPVELPEDVVFDGQGNPLVKHEKWKNTTFDGQKAVRETDTFDTFFESSWYFLRFVSQPENKAFDYDLVNKFMPVDQYVGGVEHAVLHLLYARFFVKALKKCGYLDFDEPFKNLLTQGMVCHHTFKTLEGKWVLPSDVKEEEKGKLVHIKTGEEIIRGRSEKMSKSKKNVVEPARIIDAYGADVARLFMLSDSPANRDLEWSEGGIDGCWRYVNRVWGLISGFVEKWSDELLLSESLRSSAPPQGGDDLLRVTHVAIRDVGLEYDKLGFNRAIAKIREFSNFLEKLEVKNGHEAVLVHESLRVLVLLFAPVMPHLAEECWEKLGFEGLVAKQDFPEFDPGLVKEDSVKIAVQVKSKLRAVIEMAKDTSREEMEKIARENDNVAKFLDGQEVKKVIVVPGKLVNFVV